MVVSALYLVDECLSRGSVEMRVTAATTVARRLRKSSPPAFTLIEVLVVVAILALLMAILLPSLSRARDRAKTIACAANLRTTAAALNYYLMANNDYFPPSGAWAEHSLPYVQKGYSRTRSSTGRMHIPVEFYKCPNDPVQAETGERTVRYNGQLVQVNIYLSYAINCYLVWPLLSVDRARTQQDYSLIPQSEMYSGYDADRQPIWDKMQRFSRVQRPSEIVMLADAGDDEADARNAYWDFDDEWDHSLAPMLEVHHGARTGNNFCYADQHIEYKKVLGPSVPRRGVPPVPTQWIPVSGLSGDPNPEPPAL